MDRSATQAAPRGTWPLQLLNFFMADAQAGIGPFLGVFLLAHGWESGAIGTVMTIGGVAGMLMTAPAGALVDATVHKRLYVAIPGICVILAFFWFRSNSGLWPPRRLRRRSPERRSALPLRASRWVW